MTRLASWVTAAAIIVAAGVVVALQPNEKFAQGPIVVSVGLGEQGTGRNIVAMATDVRLAEVVELDSTGARLATEGVWVVADVLVASVVSPVGLRSTLVIDGQEFRASERIDSRDGLESWTLAVGLPAQGSVMFEIPVELADRSAQLQLSPGSDSRLDNIVSVDLDLGALELASSTQALAAGRVDP